MGHRAWHAGEDQDRRAGIPTPQGVSASRGMSAWETHLAQLGEEGAVEHGGRGRLGTSVMSSSQATS